MHIKRIVLISLAIVISSSLAFALTYTSANYTLSNAKIVVSGGEASSPGYSLDETRVGNIVGGKVESANYSLDATNIDTKAPVNPPHPPTVNPVTSPTNLSSQTLSGTKDEGTSIYINGYRAVPGDNATTWHCELTLTEGDNYLIITARNQYGLESESVSAYILLDTSGPTTPQVTDDGVYTTSTTQLHASWTSSDPQTGIDEYQYAIGTTISGTDIVNWTSAGTQTEITHTNLSLIQAQTYYISVKAENGVGSWSQVGSSDGIVVNQSIPSIIEIQPPDASTGYAQDSISFSVNAQDQDGDSLLYQFSLDEQIIQPWQSSPDFNWTTSGINLGIHTMKVEVSDNLGGKVSQDIGLCLFRKPPVIPTP